MPIIYRGAITGRFYLALRIRRAEKGIIVACGKKIDITDYLRPYLKKEYLPKNEKR
ncbi:MAG TPA: hypothetical protein VF077_09785 [Nitrospiraceae bacterium]